MPETIRKHLFTHALSHLEYGRTSEDLDNVLNDCIKASQDTGKNSEVHFKLVIKPTNNGYQVHMTGEVKAKIPKLPRETTIFFPTSDGDLKRNDPRQETIPGMNIVEDLRPSEFKKIS